MCLLEFLGLLYVKPTARTRGDGRPPATIALENTAKKQLCRLQALKDQTHSQLLGTPGVSLTICLSWLFFGV